MKRLSSLVMALIVFVFFGISEADLIDNGDGTITQIRNDATYGDGSALMWLRDANRAYTSGYWDTITHNGPDPKLGSMSLEQANDWIAYLNALDSGSGYLGYNDWRLPNALPVNGVAYNDTESKDGSTDVGWNIKSVNSELSYMYYVELGNYGSYDVVGDSLGLLHFTPVPLVSNMGNSGPFLNIEPELWSARFWANAEGLYLNSDNPNYYSFWFTAGKQTHAAASSIEKPWAVRDAVNPVPVPSAILLGSIGLSFAGWRLRRRTGS